MTQWSNEPHSPDEPLEATASPRGRHAAPPPPVGRRVAVGLGVAAVGAGGVGVLTSLLNQTGAGGIAEAQLVDTSRGLPGEFGEVTYQNVATSAAPVTGGPAPSSSSATPSGAASSGSAAPTSKAPKENLGKTGSQVGTGASDSAGTKGKRYAPGKDKALAADRDQAYAGAAKSKGKPARPTKITGFTPAAGTVTAATPVGLPVKDDTKARLHFLRRAGLSGGAVALKNIEAAGGLEKWVAKQLDPDWKDPDEDLMNSWYPHAVKPIAELRADKSYHGWETQFRLEDLLSARKFFAKREIFEIVVDVLGNQLNMSVPGNDSWYGSPSYVNMLRKHAFGRFDEMLLASAREPAMLLYLNNNDSRKENVNENYGRELLELHTVGVGSKYTERDVRDSARILSGRTITQDGDFVYEPEHHATGKVKVLGFSDPNTSAAAGLKLGDRYLKYLAHHPATAATVARKLAVRFVSDSPHPDLVKELAAVYLKNKTALLPVIKAIFRSPDFWMAKNTKIRRPMEDVAGVVRALGYTAKDVGPAGAAQHDTGLVGLRDLQATVKEMGHGSFAWIPPNGYPDVTAAWQSASQMIRRWTSHRLALWGPRGFARADEVKASITPKAGVTVGQWADALSLRLLGSKATKNYKLAVAQVTGLKESDPASKVGDWLYQHAAALAFDSPEYLIR